MGVRPCRLFSFSGIANMEVERLPRLKPLPNKRPHQFFGETAVKTLSRITSILGIFALTAIGPSTAPACTGITIKPKDGSIIFARTLEFGMDLKSNILIVPRGKEFVGTAPGDKAGLRWTAKYGIVGTNAFDLPVIVDGLNEKGLHVGLFYFPGFAKYQEVKTDDYGKAIAPWELGTFLLGTCADVK